MGAHAEAKAGDIRDEEADAGREDPEAVNNGGGILGLP